MKAIGIFFDIIGIIVMMSASTIFVQIGAIIYGLRDIVSKLPASRIPSATPAPTQAA